MPHASHLAARVLAVALLTLGWPASGCSGGGCAGNEAPAGVSLAEARAWYNARVAEIPAKDEAWRAEGLDAEARAREAWTLAREARIEVRRQMQDRVAVERLRARDHAKYGDPDGPRFEDVVEEQRAAGLEGDAVYEAVIERAARPWVKVNPLASKKP